MRQGQIVLRAAVRDTLRRLGDTPEAVAETLRVKGIRGRTGWASCPVAVWLRREFPEAHRVRVHRLTVTVGVEVVSMPDAVSDFVDDFDSGEYPDLDSVVDW